MGIISEDHICIRDYSLSRYGQARSQWEEGRVIFMTNFYVKLFSDAYSNVLSCTQREKASKIFYFLRTYLRNIPCDIDVVVHNLYF